MQKGPPHLSVTNCSLTLVPPAIDVVAPSFRCDADGDAGGFGEDATPRARSDLRSRRGGIGCKASPSLGVGAVLELEKVKTIYKH